MNNNTHARPYCICPHGHEWWGWPNVVNVCLSCSAAAESESYPILPTNCNHTEDGLPYCGQPDCDIDWCWYCGDEYSEPCPRHEGVNTP